MKLDNIDLETKKMIADHQKINDGIINFQKIFFANVACLKKEVKEEVFNMSKDLFNKELESLKKSFDNWEHLSKSIDSIRKEKKLN